MIPYGRQEITRDDIQAVVDVLQSDFITQGPRVPAFEEKVAAYCGAGHAVAVNSATSALHVACLALGLGPGDWLWTSPITFVASANCGLYCGAKVDFVDIDPDTFNMCPRALERKLEAADREGRLPKVVVPVHLCGQPCDMQAIHALAQRYGFRILEDASHAVGGAYRGSPVGDCRYSDITVFSFHPVKIVTTAEGGMALTNDPDLAERMGLFRSHGVTRSPEKMSKAPDGPWYYEQIALGFNYRMTDVQAALGISQFDRLDEYVARRRQIAARYDEMFAGLPLRPQHQPDDRHSAYHLYVVRIDVKNIRSTKKGIFENLREKGIGVNIHYIPIHMQPYYKGKGYVGGDLPESEKYYEEAVTFPLYPHLKDEELNTVVGAIQKALKK